jgi:hypothetical protein
MLRKASFLKKQPFRCFGNPLFEKKQLSALPETFFFEKNSFRVFPKASNFDKVGIGSSRKLLFLAKWESGVPESFFFEKTFFREAQKAKKWGKLTLGGGVIAFLTRKGEDDYLL